MNFSQKFGLFILIIISCAYVYFSFFDTGNFRLSIPHPDTEVSPPAEVPLIEINENTELNEEPEIVDKGEKIIKIYVCDSKGNLRSVNRKCNLNTEKSCFAYAIKELIKSPSKWEKSKGFTSEIPQGTKILSVREGEGSAMIDLSSAFETGGGAESTYIRVKQIIKTAKANTNLPVYLYINGKQASVIGGEGIMVKQPLNERSLDD